MRGLEIRRTRWNSPWTASAFIATSIGGKDDLAALFEKPTDTGDAVDARLRVRGSDEGRSAHGDASRFCRMRRFAEPARLQPLLRSSVDNFDWAGIRIFRR